MNDRHVAARMLLCGAVIALALIGLGGRLAYLHLGQHDEQRASVKRNRHIRKTITVRRGNILERNGQINLLAVDAPVRDICADPMKISQDGRRAETAAALADQLDIPADEAAVKLGQTARRFVYVKRFVPVQVADRVRALKLPGVFLEDSSTRFYPQRNMLCHVLGFVNQEGVGSAGVEQQMDAYLRGSPGYVETEVNALRQEVYPHRIRSIPAIEGADVTLTIDQNVQYIAERAMEDAMRQYHAKGAWTIVQRVRTGEILAMASCPGFDPNRFTESDEDARLNRSIGYVFEPGSTFKAITIAAALNEGTVTPETKFDCENGCWSYGGKPLRDYHPYGVLTVADGLKKSSNILCAKVALTLGDRRFHAYLQAFGIGKRTGIELPGEEGGILNPTKQWSKITSTRVAMGHSVAVTSLQMLNVFCTIANGGVLMRPYVVRDVVGKDGTVLYRMTPREAGRAISLETAATMCQLLSRVTEEGGTGGRARVEGFLVAGKTGTADKPVNGRYSTSAQVASFVGFLPVERPEIGIIVVVDEPQPYHTGGLVAAPFFSRIATEAVRYLGIPPPAGGETAGDGKPLVAQSVKL